ncbi:hypothetical protein BOTBODRAFT_77080, partial [Botryobasidium botryosum FD-172 SS1]
PPISPNDLPNQTERFNEQKFKEIFKDSILNDDEKELAKALLIRHEGVLASEPTQRLFQSEEWFSHYHIPTIEHSPWNLKPIPVPANFEKEINQLILEKLNQGVYE